MKMPETQAEVVAEVERIKAELKAHDAKRRWLEGQLQAVRAMCEHPKWRDDGDPRMPSSHCLTCGAAR